MTSATHPRPEASLPIMLTEPGVWWVLVMDGRRYRLLVRDGLHARFEEHPERLADAEGHTPAPKESGHHHGRYEKTERQFVEDVARRIEGHAKAGDFDHLGVFAAPIALGVLRPALGAHTVERLRFAEDRDLSGLSLKDLRERLAGA